MISSVVYYRIFVFVRAVGSQSKDREALLALYWSSGGPRWKRNQGWVDNADDLSSWHGVTLDEQGRVSRLDLNRNQLDGERGREREGQREEDRDRGGGR